jgi:hypothetical protein
MQANTLLTSSEILNFNLKSSLKYLGIVLVKVYFSMLIETYKDKVQLRLINSSAKFNYKFCLVIAYI